MNLYFLVEGRRTERQVYPAWLAHLLPQFSRVGVAGNASDNNYYLISGNGYPRILDETLPNAIDEVNELGNFDFLVVVIDSDEEGVAEKEREIRNYIDENNLRLRNCELKIVVQNRAIETWFLGNRDVFKPVPEDEKLRDYIDFYNVSTQDPEAMGFPEDDFDNHATFHFKYLKKMLRERGVRYSKVSAGGVTDLAYLNALQSRIRDTQHLSSLQSFLDFCDRIRP